MPNPSITEAMAEAYASAPTEQVILHTLSLSHQDWESTVYLVRDYQDFVARLENGTEVTFRAAAFDLKLPELKTSSVPQVTVTLDNVAGDIFALIDQVAASKHKVILTWRPYLSNDPTAPQMNPPLALTLSSIGIDSHRIVAKAQLADLGNKTFPTDNYTLATFPSLANNG